MGTTHMMCRYGIGISAMMTTLLISGKAWESVPLFSASLFLLTITLTDTFYTKVPNLVNLALAIIGIGFHVFTNGTLGLLAAVSGCLAGFALLFPAYLFRVLGGGDVKALAALGTITGASAIFQIFLYMSLIGGLISILYYLATTNIFRKIIDGAKALQNFTYTKDINYLKPAPSNIRFPYAAAIAFGYFSYIQWGSII